MNYCYNCGHITPGEPLYCNYCGRSYDLKLCPRHHANPRSADDVLEVRQPRTVDPATEGACHVEASLLSSSGVFGTRPFFSVHVTLTFLVTLA